jgi:hypothetical protein
VFRRLTGQELIRRSGNPVQRGTRLTAGARTRWGPKSEPGRVDDSRAGHTRESKRKDATSWGRSLGSEVFVHGGAEALPWSQAPGVSGQPKLLRAPQESPVTGHELDPPERGEAACRIDRLPRQRVSSTYRSRIAETMFERLPIAACRSRLTFGGVDLIRLRRD